MMGFVPDSRWDMVFMEGYLKKSAKKRAKHRYFVLHQHSSEWKTRLDCFDNGKSWTDKKQPRYTIYLADVFNVEAVSSGKFPRSFGLYTTSRKIYLSAASEQEMQSWVDVIRFNKTQEDLKNNASQAKMPTWNVKFRARCNFKNSDQILYSAAIITNKIEFTQQQKTISSIQIRNVLKHGFTENCSYLEVSEGGYEITENEKGGDMKNALVDLGSGTILMWIEFESADQAETFSNEILLTKKSFRKRSNTLEQRIDNRRLDFKRTMSHSDTLLEFPPRTSENQETLPLNLCRSMSAKVFHEEEVFNDYVINSNRVSGEYQQLSFSATSDNGDSRNEIEELYGSPTSFGCYSIKDHLLNKATGTSGPYKTSTSSQFGDDEREVNDNNELREGNDHQTNEEVLDNVFMKFKFHTDSKPNEEYSKKRKKFNRNRDSHETVTATNFLQKKNSTSVGTSPEGDETNMDPVSLVALKTQTHHFQEPHYEAIRDFGVKGGIKGVRSHSNSSTPEGSPKIFHNRKYVLNNRPKTPSPKLGLKMFTPPLPKRNQSSSEQVKSTSPAYSPTSPNNNNNNNKNYTNISFTKKSEPKYTDVDLKNIKNNSKKNRLFKSKVDHPYSEIVPKPRGSLNSSDLENPVFPPMRNMTPPTLENFRPNPLFGAVIIDGSKSDGDLSDSEVLDVPRFYNRRRSKTGTTDLSDPSRFYAVPDQKPRRSKQPHRIASYEKDYVATTIKSRSSNRSTSSLKETHDTDNESAAYENSTLTATLGRPSLSTDDESEHEPTYENPDIRIVNLSSDSEQPTYENNELLTSNVSPEYATVRPSSLTLSRNSRSNSPESLDSSRNNITIDSCYDNVTIPQKQQLEYADIRINRHLYGNISSPDEDVADHPSYYRQNSSNYSDSYTQIDFQKSDGLKEALNQLRVGEKGSPEMNTDYKIDLSHIKFTKSAK